MAYCLALGCRCVFAVLVERRGGGSGSVADGSGYWASRKLKHVRIASVTGVNWRSVKYVAMDVSELQLPQYNRLYAGTYRAWIDTPAPRRRSCDVTRISSDSLQYWTVLVELRCP